jgi:hypothetical protein
MLMPGDRGHLRAMRLLPFPADAVEYGSNFCRGASTCMDARELGLLIVDLRRLAVSISARRNMPSATTSTRNAGSHGGWVNVPPISSFGSVRDHWPWMM